MHDNQTFQKTIRTKPHETYKQTPRTSQEKRREWNRTDKRAVQELY
jgi:hypothetical protein